MNIHYIISYDIANNFTSDSIVNYLERTYKVNIIDKKIYYSDPAWYGRGGVKLSMSDLYKIPVNWTSFLSETLDELEFISDEE